MKYMRLLIGIIFVVASLLKLLTLGASFISVGLRGSQMSHGLSMARQSY